jgi:hypothetical protein
MGTLNFYNRIKWFTSLRKIRVTRIQHLYCQHQHDKQCITSWLQSCYTCLPVRRVNLGSNQVQSMISKGIDWRYTKPSHIPRCIRISGMLHCSFMTCVVFVRTNTNQESVCTCGNKNFIMCLFDTFPQILDNLIKLLTNQINKGNKPTKHFEQTNKKFLLHKQI